MTEPGKRGGGFKPGGAADQRVKKRAAKLIASQDKPPLKSVEDVEAIFLQIAAIFRKHGRPRIGQPDRNQLTIEHWHLNTMTTSPVGPFTCIQAPNWIAYHRPDKKPPKFGWLERIDFRRGSPTELAALLQLLKDKGLE